MSGRGGCSKKFSFLCKYFSFAVVVFLATWLAEEEPRHTFKGASARLEAASPLPHISSRRGGETEGSVRGSKCKIRLAGHQVANNSSSSTVLINPQQQHYHQQHDPAE